MTHLKILLADDHPLFRNGVRSVVESAEGMEIVGEATTGDEAVRLALELRPDLVLMDIRMPGLNGIEATARIRSTNPAIRILMLTMFKDDESVINVMKAGAQGYMLKDADRDDIIRAIRSVAAGESIFDGDVANRLIAYATRPSSRLDEFPGLTYREKEVFALLVQGHANAVISRKLQLSPKTVANYISALLNKLHVADKEEAIRLYRRSGL